MQARVDTAKGLEDRARLAVETAGTDVAKILAEARAASAVLVNEATAQGAAALEAAEAEVRAAKKRAAVASEKADAADERAAAAEARAEAASEQLAAIREKLGG